MAAQQTLFERLMHEKEHEQKKEQRNPRTSILLKAIIILITLGMCTFFFSFHLNRQYNEIGLTNIVPGYIWPRPTLKADFSFPVYKDDGSYQKEVEDARNNTLLVFLLNPAIESNSQSDIDTLTDKFAQKNNDRNQKLKSLLSETAKKDNLFNYQDLKPRDIRAIEREVQKFADGIYRQGYVNISLDLIPSQEITVRMLPNTEKLYPVVTLTDSNSLAIKAKQYFASRFPANLVPTATEIAVKLIKPNLVYSRKLTEIARDLNEKSVPKTDGIVRQGETIIEKGERVNGINLKKLQSYERSRFLRSDTKYTFWIFLGSLGHASLIYTILILYLIFIRKRILADNVQIAILSFALVMTAFMSWLSLEVPSRLPIQYFISVPALAMLMAIVFDSRTAFYVTITMSLMLSGIRGNDYDSGIAMLFAGILGAYTVRDIQSRTQMFKSIFFISIGFIIPIISFGLERSADFNLTLNRSIIAILNASISPLITFGLLFILERITNITTDLRLQEFNTVNHPLLIKMSEIAPGTYQHTLAMATLAEKCAKAIGANPLLAKVGAYFHDVGKLAKPEYYVENQMDNDIDNKHSKLPPKKSASAIKSHVLEGEKIAREYHLPQRIANFIPMHHGTYLIKHFYAKALEEADGHEVREEDFRYPGPKPNSKETAIVMICDSAEAISRIANKDKEELEKIIEKTIQDRLLDGQFDDSNLTMKDLHDIRETCIRNLYGIGHQRVEYKQLPQEKVEG